MPRIVVDVIVNEPDADCQTVTAWDDTTGHVDHRGLRSKIGYKIGYA